MNGKKNFGNDFLNDSEALLFMNFRKLFFFEIRKTFSPQNDGLEYFTFFIIL